MIKIVLGTSLAFQWLRLCASNARSLGLIPGWGTKIPHAVQCSQKIKTKKKKARRRCSRNVCWPELLRREKPQEAQLQRGQEGRSSGRARRFQAHHPLPPARTPGATRSGSGSAAPRCWRCSSSSHPWHCLPRYSSPSCPCSSPGTTRSAQHPAPIQERSTSR